MDQYGFETVAIRRNVFIGLSSRYNWTPELSQQLTACRTMPTAPACSEAVRFFANWVKSVLSVQLTTFPVG
jgi:hypothetical protein